MYVPIYFFNKLYWYSFKLLFELLVFFHNTRFNNFRMERYANFARINHEYVQKNINDFLIFQK
jgi:hypothetical protein